MFIPTIVCLITESPLNFSFPLTRVNPKFLWADQPQVKNNNIPHTGSGIYQAKYFPHLLPMDTHLKAVRDEDEDRRHGGDGQLDPSRFHVPPLCMYECETIRRCVEHLRSHAVGLEMAQSRESQKRKKGAAKGGAHPHRPFPVLVPIPPPVGGGHLLRT
jgi:hypothetical protein